MYPPAPQKANDATTELLLLLLTGEPAESRSIALLGERAGLLFTQRARSWLPASLVERDVVGRDAPSIFVPRHNAAALADEFGQELIHWARE